MLESSFHCERFIFLSGLKMASAELFVAFIVVAACDLYMGRNISAKGPLLIEGADDTALSLEHLHEIGNEKSKAYLHYTDATHRHLTSKYRHSTVQISAEQIKHSRQRRLGLCSWHHTTCSVVLVWKLHFWKLQNWQLYLTCIDVDTECMY